MEVLLLACRYYPGHRAKTTFIINTRENLERLRRVDTVWTGG